MIIVGLITFMASLFLTWIVKYSAEKAQIFEKYNYRRIDEKQKIRIGGISFVTVFMVSLPFSSLVISNSFIWIVIGLWIVFIGGLIDDIFEIRPLIKTIFDLSGAIIVVLFGNLTIDQIVLPLGIIVHIPIILNIILPIFWILAVINVMNLIDGLDGLSSGIAIITLSTISLVSYIQGDYMMTSLSFTFVFSLLGFIPWNWYPSKIIMGDCGSRSIGYIIGTISLIGFKNITFMSIIIPFALLTIPILDTLFAIIRRKRRKISFSEADRGHIHHKLFDHFEGSQVKAVLSIYFITILFSLSSIAYSFTKFLGIILLFISLVITIYIFLKIQLITLIKKENDEK